MKLNDRLWLVHYQISFVGSKLHSCPCGRLIGWIGNEPVTLWILLCNERYKTLYEKLAGNNRIKLNFSYNNRKLDVMLYIILFMIDLYRFLYQALFLFRIASAFINKSTWTLNSNYFVPPIQVILFGMMIFYDPNESTDTLCLFGRVKRNRNHFNTNFYLLFI